MLARIFSLLTQAGRLLVLPFTHLRSASASPQALTWCLHGGLLVAILAGLGWTNHWLELDRAVRAPSPWLRNCWLPMLFAIGYALAWVAWWTWQTSRGCGPASPFPDLDLAWKQAIQELEQRGVGVAERPIVLLLGARAGGEARVTAALGIEPSVGPFPSLSGAPLQVLADKQAIYLLLPEASLLSRHAERLAQRRFLSAYTHPRLSPRTAVDPALPLSESQMPIPLQASGGGEASITRRGDDMGRDLQEAESQLSLALQGIDAWDDLLMPPAGEQIASVRNAFEPDALEADEAALAAARLRHVLRLLRTVREPQLPVSGIQVLVPWGALGRAAQAEAFGETVGRELAILREVCGADCPVSVAVVDLELASGCNLLLGRIPMERRGGRLGIEFPQSFMARPEYQTEAVQRGIEWLCADLTPAVCRRLFECRSEVDGEHALEVNAELFRFQLAAAGLEQPLKRLLLRALGSENYGFGRLRGIYLVATGAAEHDLQGFGEGVAGALLACRHEACWTEAARRSDAWDASLARGGYGMLAASLAAILFGLLG